MLARDRRSRRHGAHHTLLPGLPGRERGRC